MLVIERNFGEMIKVGDAFIKIRPSRITPGKIDFVIDAPKHIKIDRLDCMKFDNIKDPKIIHTMMNDEPA